MSESRNPWPFRVLGAVIALSLAAWLAFGYDWGDETEDDESSIDAPSADRRSEQPETLLADEQGSADEDEPPPDERPIFDPSELAELLYDGGIPEEAPAYDPDPTVATADPDRPPVTEIDLPPTRNVRPGGPRRALSRAVFWRGMLEQRIQRTQAELEEAQAAGNQGAEQRATRMLERLQAQQPELQQRIMQLSAAAELEAHLPPLHGEQEAEPEGEAQGEY